LIDKPHIPTNLQKHKTHIKSLQITKTEDKLKETTNRSRKAQVVATSRQMKYPLVNVYITTENHNFSWIN
jgi:hypothetical protein